MKALGLSERSDDPPLSGGTNRIKFGYGTRKEPIERKKNGSRLIAE